MLMKSTLSRQIRWNFGFDVKQHFASKDMNFAQELKKRGVIQERKPSGKLSE
jgi:hypothetical protein